MKFSVSSRALGSQGCAGMPSLGGLPSKVVLQRGPPAQTCSGFFPAAVFVSGHRHQLGARLGQSEELGLPAKCQKLGDT